MGLGKFKKAPRKITFPLAVATYLAFLGFALCLAIVALAQPILWIMGRVSALDAALTTPVLLVLAGLVFLFAKLVDRISGNWL